jgi:hypothetical protein
MSSNIDRFAELFKGINFEIKIVESIEEIEKQKTEKAPEFKAKVKVDLNRALQKAKSELAAAKKAFKQGKISDGELFDMEWRVFELKEQLDRMQDDRWGEDDEFDDFELGGES